MPEQTMLQTEDRALISGPRVRTPQYLTAGPSIILDIVRFLAALTVAIGHVSQGYFTTGWPPILMSFASGAVAVFFVLSGFMIRYITTVKYGDLRRYTVDRVARIYSVAIPAVALTVLFDVLSAHLNPLYYAGYFRDTARPVFQHLPWLTFLLSQTWFRGLIRVVVGLAMLSQSWFRDSTLLSNLPFWSLSYECVFYAVFGIAIYLRSKQRVIAWIVVFLMIGPTIFLMFPLWLLGCVAYDAYQDGAITKNSLAKFAALSLLSIACVHGARALVDHFHIGWFYLGRLVQSMDIVAIATVVVLTPLCIATRNLRISEQHPLVRSIRRIAASTYPLYLIHFPLFVLFAAALPYPRASLWAKFMLLAAAITLSLLLTGPCDSFKDYLRKKLLRPRNV